MPLQEAKPLDIQPLEYGSNKWPSIAPSFSREKVIELINRVLRKGEFADLSRYRLQTQPPRIISWSHPGDFFAKILKYNYSPINEVVVRNLMRDYPEASARVGSYTPAADAWDPSMIENPEVLGTTSDDPSRPGAARVNLRRYYKGNILPSQGYISFEKAMGTGRHELGHVMGLEDKPLNYGGRYVPSAYDINELSDMLYQDVPLPSIYNKAPGIGPSKSPVK